MKNIILLVFLFIFGFCECTIIKCNKHEEDCNCFTGEETELQCPSDLSKGGLLVHIKSRESLVQIDCVEPVKTPLNIDLLPHMTVGAEFNNFLIRFCPLPEKQFQSVIDKFSATNVTALTYEGFNNTIAVLDETYFKGLDHLEKLKLNDIDLKDPSENIFVNTPKLIVIDLQNNKMKLKSNIFHSTQLLKSLDLAQNELDSLPDGLFQNSKNLISLHLWSNKLTEINDFTFKGLPNLQTLELSHNKISNISENGFEDLKSLKEVNLSQNKLTILPSRLFQANTMLNRVLLNENLNLTLPDYVFANLKELKEVYLRNCNLRSLPEHIFENSIGIKTIYLNNNLLTDLSSEIFKGLEKLEILYLENNQIENLAPILVYPKNLIELHLERNRIRKIESDDFINSEKLQKIYLKRNRISEIEKMAFRHTPNLTVIDLSRNKISKPSGCLPPFSCSILHNVMTVEDVNFSYNQITSVEDVIYLENKVNLKKLDLRNNFIDGTISVKDFVSLSSVGMEVKLDGNNVTTVDFALADKVGPSVKDSDAFHNNKIPSTTISLTDNPIVCDCRNYGLFRYFQGELPEKVFVQFKIKTQNLTCHSPSEFENILLDRFPLQYVTCPMEDIVKDNYNGCPEGCFCYWRPYDNCFSVDCSNNNFTTFPNIILPDPKEVPYNQTEINFEYNNLIEGPSNNSVAYYNVTKMIISNNKIKTISWLPPKLKILKLHNNFLHKLDNQVLNILNTSHLLNLTLENNPWVCDCEIEPLTHFIRQRRQVDGSHVYCANSSTLLTSLSKSDVCPTFSILFVIIPVLSILLTAAVLAALYYRYQQELKVWLFAKNLCLWWVTEQDLDKDKIYDAFISYSHKDEDFVIQNLLPNLEGKEGYKLCLHYRNWVPGEFIAKQVTNSVCESRRTVVVLSPNFLESVWGKLEFRTAHTQAMTEGRARVIILLYGDVDIDSLDNELKSYLKTNTYVKWGDPYFWNKLKYALPHHKKSMPNSQKHANVMQMIDDKFQLVTPVTASPGSTPPVLTLDPNGLLKKHPLSFVPTPEMDTPPAEAGTLLTVTTT